MPEGNAPAVRQATTKARDLVEAEIDEYEKRSPARASLREDVETVTERLGSLDPAAKGVYVVANSSIAILDVEPLGLPIETKVTVAPIPALKRLAQMVEDYPMYAILQVDQQLRAVVVRERGNGCRAPCRWSRATSRANRRVVAGVNVVIRPAPTSESRPAPNGSPKKSAKRSTKQAYAG